jgi:hypothetical protein
MQEQSLLYHVINHREKVLPRIRIVSQESDTDVGRIDLVGVDSSGKWAIIEVENALNFYAIGQVMVYSAYFAHINDIELDFLRKIIICREARKVLRETCDKLGVETVLLKEVEDLPPIRLFKINKITRENEPNLLRFSCSPGEYALLIGVRSENMQTFNPASAAKFSHKPLTSMPYYLQTLLQKHYIEKMSPGKYRVIDRVWAELGFALNIDDAWRQQLTGESN